MTKLRYCLLILMTVFVIVLCSCDVTGDNTFETDASEPVVSESATTETAESVESESETQCAHINTEEVAISVESCKNGGYYNIVCRDCKTVVDVMTAEILDHVESKTIVDSEPTCTKEGRSHVECVLCGEVLKSSKIGALNHSLSSWKIEIEAGAETEGKKHRECSRCDYEEYVTIPAAGYSEGLEFVTNGDGTCYLAGIGKCNDDIIFVPKTSVDGDTVVSVAAFAFSDGGYFDREYSFKKIVLPDTVEVIGEEAFSACHYLESIGMPANLKTIGERAFVGCFDLKNLTIPDGVIEIGERAFYLCNGITKLHIPASVEKIGDGFLTADKITSITVDTESERYRVEGNCLISDEGRVVVGYGNFTIPEGAVSIGDYAFEMNEHISKVVIPVGVVEIGNDAFMNSSVVEVVFPEGLTEISEYMFFGCVSLEKITIPRSVKRIGTYIIDDFEAYDISITYNGSQSEWNRIDVASDNETLLNAEITCIGVDTVYGYGKTTIADQVSAVHLYELFEKAVLADQPLKEIEVDPSLGIKVEDFELAKLIFFSDHPECFWWRGQASYSYTSDNVIVSISFTYNYNNDEIAAKRAELEAVVEEILADLPTGDNFVKALYLHDEVAKRVTYKFTENDQTPYGALVEGEAVCNGYATSYQLLLQRAGIRAWTVNGTSRDEAHAWNVVWMDDNTCVYTDVTWDDGEYLSRYYFNMSLDEIDDDHAVNGGFDLPECDHNDQGYYDVNEENTLRDEDDGSVLASFFGEEKNGERVAAFRYLGEDISLWLDENGYDFYNRVGVISLRYFTVGDEIIMIIEVLK